MINLTWRSGFRNQEQACLRTGTADLVASCTSAVAASDLAAPRRRRRRRLHFAVRWRPSRQSSDVGPGLLVSWKADRRSSDAQGSYVTANRWADLFWALDNRQVLKVLKFGGPNQNEALCHRSTCAGRSTGLEGLGSYHDTSHYQAYSHSSTSISLCSSL